MQPFLASPWDHDLLQRAWSWGFDDLKSDGSENTVSVNDAAYDSHECEPAGWDTE